jgi:hypothetical protein
MGELILQRTPDSKILLAPEGPSTQAVQGGGMRALAAISALIASNLIGCTNPTPIQNQSDPSVRHYRLVDRAVNPVPGAPRFLDVAIPSQYMDTRILSPPPEGVARALFVSAPSSLTSPDRYFCRMSYSSPDPIGTVGEWFPVDPSLAPRFGLPDGFVCRKGIHTSEGRPLESRYVDYYCEDPSVRAAGGQLETNCKFESSVPTATCLLAVRIPSRAYLDCEYPPTKASEIRTMAADVSERVESFVRREPVTESLAREPK